ncbi:MAG TPA: hypothetical protein VMR86_15395 [Myxococcota bacterium]|nr:hypothetical protein [Myxococcota bacterium]
MEIEQIVGGVGGNTDAQAITLRMRSSFQNQVVGNAQLRAWDAAGTHPVTVATFTGTNPTDANACKEILLATSAMGGKTQPAVAPDFTMLAPIPATYLNAGSLTFEGAGGAIIYWRVVWGGAGYSGLTTLSTTNDPNGDVAPAFASALPSTGVQALRFSPTCGTPSQTSLADYAAVTAPVTLRKNSGTTFNVVDLLPVPALPGAAQLLLPALLGLGLLGFAIRRRRPES